MPEKNRKIGLGSLSVEMSGKENVCVKMASNKKCVICQLSDESDSIPLLNSNKLQKCLEVLQVREKLKLKYSEVFLPAEINGTHGCHFQCYKNFTAVPKKYITKYMELMGSRTLTDIPSTSSTSTSTDSVAGQRNSPRTGGITSRRKFWCQTHQQTIFTATNRSNTGANDQRRCCETFDRCFSLHLFNHGSPALVKESWNSFNSHFTRISTGRITSCSGYIRRIRN